MQDFPEMQEYTGDSTDEIQAADGVDSDEKLINRITNFEKKHKPNYVSIQKIAKRNRDYWRGKQIDEKDLYVGESPIIDNRIFTSVETIVPIVTRKTPEPDLTVRPFGGRNRQLQEKVEAYLKELWEDELDQQEKTEEMVRNLFASRYGAVKIFYDEDDEIVATKVMPMGKVIFNIKADTVDDTPLIEYVSITLGEMIDRFPDKEEEIRKAAGLVDADDESEVEYMEWWSNEEYICKYKNILLHREANPYWNFEDPWGEEDTEGEEDEDLSTKRHPKSFNHFNRPKKPYILLNHMTWGDSLIDDTTTIEQAIPLQDSINKRKRQTEQNAGMANGKIIGAGKRIAKEDFDDIDNSPEQKIYLENAETTVGAIQLEYGRALDQGLFTDMQHSIAEIDNLMGTHATTRGEQTAQETATGRAILKDSDAGRQEVLSRRIEKYAKALYNWIIQIMYTHYDEQHPVHYTAKPNNTNHLTAREREVYIHRDEFKDVKITVKVQNGSTVPRDKTTQKSEAVELATKGLMSKLDMYKILEYSNPEDLARNAYLEQNAPQMLYEVPTGDVWEIEAIRHTSAIVDSEYPDDVKIEVFGSDDPNLYTKHLTTHIEYLKGAEIDPDVVAFDELDLETKQKLIEHIEMEKTQAEELANELQSQMGGLMSDPAMGQIAEQMAAQGGVEDTAVMQGGGQLAAEALAGGQMSPPPQVMPPMV